MFLTWTTPRPDRFVCAAALEAMTMTPSSWSMAPDAGGLNHLLERGLPFRSPLFTSMESGCWWVWDPIPRMMSR